MSVLSYTAPLLKVLHVDMGHMMCTSPGNKTERIVYSEEEVDF